MSGQEAALSADDIVDLGEEHHRAGRLQDAESHYRKAIQIDPGHPGALYYLANIAYEDGRLEFSAELIEELLRGDPSDAEAWHLRGMIAFKQENSARANDCFIKALAIQPVYAQAHYGLGMLVHQQGDLEGALASFQRALECNPVFFEAHYALANIFKAQNKYEEALSGYQQVLSEKSKFPLVYEDIGEIFLFQDKLEDAITTFRKAIAENADSVRAHAGLGDALLSSHQHAAAASSLERAITLQPDIAVLYHSYGCALHALHRSAEALLNFDTAITLEPYNPEAYCNRALALRSLDRLADALVSYDKAIALAPDYADAKNGRDSLLQNSTANEGSSLFVEKSVTRYTRLEAASAALEQVLPADQVVPIPKPPRLYKCPPPPGFESHYADYCYVPDCFTGKKSLLIDGREVHVMARRAEPNVVVFDNILSDVECELLISLSRPKLRRSETYDRKSHAGETMVHPDRTSEGAFFQLDENALVRAIEIRLAKLMNLPAAYGEGLQVLHYGEGAEYLPHYDFFAPEDAGSAAYLQARGQRVATFIMYLNDVESGGETIFPDIDFSVTPRKGGAVYFSYCDAAGKLDRLTLHGGASVKRGEKWIATKWIRERSWGRPQQF